MHRTLRNYWRIVALLVAIALLLTLVPASVTAAPQQQTGVVATANVNLRMRSGPGTGYDVVGNFPQGTTANVEAKNAAGTWLLVNYNGQRGWVAGWYIIMRGNVSGLSSSTEIISGGGGGVTLPATGIMAAPSVNLRMRSGPGTSYPTLGTVPKGTSVDVLGRNSASNWVMVSYNGGQGWVAAWLATFSADISAAPVTSQGGSAPTSSSRPTTPVISSGSYSGFAIGGQTHTLNNPGTMHSAGMTWVKFQVKWGPGANPSDYANQINNAHANGFRILLSVTGPEHPSSIDFGAYVNFVQGLAALGADAIEIWNEMNLDREWPAGEIYPATYVNAMLAPAYNAIKTVNPGTMVISGALAPTGYHNGITVWRDDIYIAGMRDAGAEKYMDCVGVHHNAGATSPAVQYGHPGDSGDHHYSWYFTGTYNLYASTFKNTPICFTEIGYLSPDGYGGLPPNFWWGSGTSITEHATWLGEAASIARNTGNVRLFIVFSVDILHWGSDPQAGYAIIRPGGVCPACGPLAAAS